MRGSDAVAREVAQCQRRSRRRRDDLDELEQLHLVDLVGQHFRDRRDLREQVGVGVHQPVAHRGPMIEPLVAAADALRLLRVPCRHRWIGRGDARQQRRPRNATLAVLGHAGLQTALVSVGARIADVLVAVGLSKEDAEADATRRVDGGGIRPLARAIARPRSATSLNGVGEDCALAGGACMI